MLPCFSLYSVCSFYHKRLLPSRNQEQQSQRVRLRHVGLRSLLTTLLCPHTLILRNRVWVVLGLFGRNVDNSICKRRMARAQTENGLVATRQ
jgi:hypothetical protein